MRGWGTPSIPAWSYDHGYDSVEQIGSVEKVVSEFRMVNQPTPPTLILFTPSTRSRLTFKTNGFAQSRQYTLQACAFFGKENQRIKDAK